MPRYDDDDDFDRPRRRKYKVGKRDAPTGAALHSIILQMAASAGCILISLVTIPLPLVNPNALVLSILINLVILIIAFILASVFARQAGNHVPFNYLHMDDQQWMLVFFMFGCLLPIMGYFIFWIIAHIRTAIEDPKKMLPWVAVQAFCIFAVVAASFVAAFSSHLHQERVRRDFGMAASIRPASPDAPSLE